VPSAPSSGSQQPWGPTGYGTPPPPPQPARPNPLVENLKHELVGDFPATNDAAQGKTWAILSYLPGVFIPVWLIPLVKRDNHLSLFHAKQMLGFALLQVPAWAIFLILNSLVRGLPQKQVGLVLSILLMVGLGLTFLAVGVVGLLGAMKGQVKPLPLIGRTIDRMTRNLTVCPPVTNAEPQLAYWFRVAPVQPRPAPAPAPGQPHASAPGPTPASAPPQPQPAFMPPAQPTPPAPAAP